MELDGCSIHILALAVLLGYRWILDQETGQMIVNLFSQHFKTRRRGVASLLLQQVLCQNELSITVEVQVIICFQ